MRIAVVTCLCSLAAVAVAAQQPRTTEIGIQGGFARLHFTGQARYGTYDFYDVPGSSYFGLVPIYGTLFVEVPVGARVSLEPQVRFSQYTWSTPQSMVGLGLRANVSLGHGVYAGAGGLVSFINISLSTVSSVSEQQLGVSLAAGYRFGLGASLNGRLEGQTLIFHKTNTIAPYAVYALTFGLSAPVSSAPARRTARRWDPWGAVIGIQAGYSWSHDVGGTGVAHFSIPEIGTSEFAGFGLPTPAPLFVFVPLSPRLALDAGFDAHLIHSGTFPVNGGFLTGQVNPRLDVRVSGGWYAGAGPAFWFTRDPFHKLSVISGASIASGFRFPLTATLGGRLEIGYTMYRQHLTRGFGAVNALAVTAGTTLPL